MSSRWLALLPLLLIAACADLERGAPSPDAALEPDAAAVQDGVPVADGVVAGLSFARDIHPILVDRCGRCHSDDGQASETSMILGTDPARDLIQIRKLVNPDNPAGSRLLVKGAGAGHGGGAIISSASAEYRTVLQWISLGSAP
jgi:hypothetical protein